jgi:hypothetical protein
MVRWLSVEGKAGVDQSDSNGDTPLYLAVNEGDVDIVQWLIGEGKARESIWWDTLTCRCTRWQL